MVALTPQTEIIILACVVAVACALPGVFLVLRKMAMMSDAISHSILLGIVLAFFYTKTLASPLLILGATLMGLITVSLTEMIFRTKKVKEDASIGLVFPFLFAFAVILINLYASDVHIDTDAVLLGEIAFAPFNRLILSGVDVGPQALWVIGAILLFNVAFIKTFYKELKLATFDPGLAASLGFSPAIIHYSLMGMVSITAVGSFDAVGSILVVALMIAPPAAAYMLTRCLSSMLYLSAGIGVLSAITGYFVAHILDASIAGSMAGMSGVFFGLVLLFAPQRGLLAKVLLHSRQKLQFAMELMLVHLLHHEGTAVEKQENTIMDIKRHMKWSDVFRLRVITKAVREGLITRTKGKLFLTNLGRDTAVMVMKRT